MADFDEKPVIAVQKHINLYDTASEPYKDRVQRENSWISIAWVGIWHPEKRWKALREKFARTKKAKHLPSGSAAAKAPRFDLYEQMRFLEQFVKERK